MQRNYMSELSRLLGTSGADGSMKFYKFDRSGSAEIITPDELARPHSVDSLLQQHQAGIIDIIGAESTPGNGNGNGGTSRPFEEFIPLEAQTESIIDKRMNNIGRIVSEVTEFSEHLNFLSMLSSKAYGTKQLIPLLRTVMFEMAGRIHAARSFISIHNNDIVEMIETNDMDIDEAMHHLRNPLFKTALESQSAVHGTIDDGRSMLVAPLLTQNGPRGFMTFFRLADEPAFTVADQQIVSIISCSMSSTVEAIFLYDFLRETYMNTVRALATAIEAKDAYTHGHSHRVAKYSTYIGKSIGMNEDELHNLEIAAYMHDIGKIGIKESVLCKPGRLTEEEFEEIRMHPIYTEKILEPINLPRFILDAAVHHHERMKGQGYPYGRSGAELSAPSRIIAVADVFDALTSDRIYRGAMSVEQAVGIIVKGIGDEFDSDAVNGLCGHFLDNDVRERFIRAHPHLTLDEEDILGDTVRKLYSHHGHAL